MKSRMLSFLLAILLSSAGTQAQVTYEGSYPTLFNSPHSFPVLLNMGHDDYKWMSVDYTNNQFNLYNLNHTLYTTVTIPVPLYNPTRNYIAYVSWSLFDCDSSDFEYVVIPHNYLNDDFYIFRQDGTQLFREDSVSVYTCSTCAEGAYDMRPIMNTPSGAKLMLQKNFAASNTTRVQVYSLCGFLPCVAQCGNEVTSVGLQEQKTMAGSFVNVFPNPSETVINFAFDLPSNTKEIEMKILDVSGKLIKTIKIDSSQRSCQLDNTGFVPGLYFYSLSSKDKILQNGKFVVSK
jgi:hypothetical protein